MAKRVSLMRTEDIDADLRAEIVEVCIAAHDSEDFNRLFSYFIPSGGLHSVAFDGETVVAHAVATTRWLQPEGHPQLKTAYIDAVSTLPEYQGKGWGSDVMRALATAIDAEYEVACLETDREGFYSRLGWETWRGPLAGRSDDGLVPTPDQRGVMVLRLSRTPELDFDAGMTIECQAERIW